MKKFLSVISMLALSVSGFSQNGSFEPDPSAVSGNKSSSKNQIALSTRSVKEDKIDVIDVTGLGGTTFSALNLPDGTSARGDRYSLKITMSLLTGANKTAGYQLVFNPDGEKNTYAVEAKDGITSVNFPQFTFEVIRQKLEQSLAAKKKVQLKITQNPSGFREGVLVF